MEAENPSSATQPTSQCLEIPKERLSKNTFDKSGLIEGAELASARGRAPPRGSLPETESDAETETDADPH